MHTVKASEFKAKCLALMDEVARSGEPILITKNGKPVAELRQVSPPAKKDLYGAWRHRLIVKGDIVAPVATDDWEALQ